MIAHEPDRTCFNKKSGKQPRHLLHLFHDGCFAPLGPNCLLWWAQYKGHSELIPIWSFHLDAFQRSTSQSSPCRPNSYCWWISSSYLPHTSMGQISSLLELNYGMLQRHHLKMPLTHVKMCIWGRESSRTSLRWSTSKTSSHHTRSST